ncbi:MAG: UDP-N-acetylglucosamine 2-epimerase (non-hydrolyzing) [Clostridiales bacterium]|jgi:UDP-N-acetylglucosamine 2-epimerase (non-hydrolysing)|nr:UDP-N-acetylglucosamine 2-epimerase (non-hydrolyzing) [Clostridiales bacterium]
MANKKKITLVFGTRPEAIKMSPLVLALKTRPEFETSVLVTAQHRELLDSVLEAFGVAPDVDLNIMSPGQSLTEITCKALTGVGEALQSLKPDLVLVHGDTATTFAASLAAFYAGIAVGHVEAGLRTFNKREPFPEEIYRLLTTRLADLYFPPTAEAKDNLLRENIPSDNIFVTGNTEIDALYTLLGNKNWPGFKNSAFNRLDKEKKLVVMTAHRRENLGSPMEGICRVMSQIIEENEGVQLVWPMHPNPDVRRTARAFLGGRERVNLTEADEVDDMYHLLNICDMVVTDSGAIQEISASLHKPCVVLRNVTERPEGVATGALKLGGNTGESVYGAVTQVLRDSAVYYSMAKARNPFGDGKASERIVSGLLYHFGYSQNRPEDFKLNN